MANIGYHDLRKVWLVEHPISQYNEDVKFLAIRHNLKIYDPAVTDAELSLIEENPPELTKRTDPVKPMDAKPKPKLVRKEPK
jgi:hypothetical protein